jgi:hypothetical protein
MPVTVPATSERNFTPTSTANASGSLGVPGAVELLQMLQGQAVTGFVVKLAVAGGAGEEEEGPEEIAEVTR